MKTEPCKVQLTRLSSELQGITRHLVEDNWYGMTSADGQHRYYIIGANEFDAEADGVEYSLMLLPQPTKPGPLADSYVRSQVAGSKDYLQEVRNALKKRGLPPTAVDRLADGDLDGIKDFFSPDVSSEVSLTLIKNAAEALTVHRSRGRVPAMDAEDDAAADIVREKNCLKEFMGKYQKIVGRWEKLEALPFDDPQLQEASRAYLYGFYRAAIVLSVCAVETQLKLIYPDEDLANLIDRAERDGRLASDLQTPSVRRKRNKVVHEGVDPTYDMAREVLYAARKIVSELRQSQT